MTRVTVDCRTGCREYFMNYRVNPRLWPDRNFKGFKPVGLDDRMAPG